MNQNCTTGIPKRALTLFLILAFVLSMLPMTVFAAQITTALNFTTGGSRSGNGYEWDEATKTLTLDDLDLRVNANGPAIKLPDGSTIVLEGTSNSVVNTGSNFNSDGINCAGSLTIEGSSELTVTVGACGIYAFHIAFNGGTSTIKATKADGVAVDSFNGYTFGSAMGYDGSDYTIATKLASIGMGGGGFYTFVPASIASPDFGDIIKDIRITGGSQPPVPTVTGISADPATIATPATTSTITVSGTDLPAEVTVTAFDGATDTGITGTTTGGKVTLTFPENTDANNKIYTIKASLDGGTTWQAATCTVTVLGTNPSPPPNPPSPPAPSSKSSSSSGGGGTSQPSAPSNTPSDVSKTQAADAAKAAAKAAKTSGDTTATVRIKNPGNITLDALKDMAKAAGMQVKFQADSMSENGNTVEVRITLDPSKAANGLNLSASTTSTRAEATTAIFEKNFNNNVTVVSLGQQGSFGQPVEIAAKIDLKGMDTNNLVFYSYDKATGKYTKIANPAYRIDKNGYVHFTTELAGDIIVSEGPLMKK